MAVNTTRHSFLCNNKEWLSLRQLWNQWMRQADGDRIIYDRHTKEYEWEKCTLTFKLQIMFFERIPSRRVLSSYRSWKKWTRPSSGPHSHCFSRMDIYELGLSLIPKQMSQNEPPHDKTKKMTVRPAKTQINLGIRPVWSESSLCAQCIAKDPSFLHAYSEDWSESLLGAHSILLLLSWGG